MKYLYKYPQKKFPYEDLVEENAKRTRLEREYQILDTGVFEDNEYWDIFIETAKEDDDEEEKAALGVEKGEHPVMRSRDRVGGETVSEAVAS